ncbi:V-type ATP synthase subunit E [Murdochiella massiliensis]|uniref:V-type ATP synthase subunit E n=1 Tax=Murdochiella massiliensis TaxID=1673723 RepID=UPI0008308C50|nr:V-type ATP synthase subunit E [Murdochiella massiliensis]
MAQLEQLIEQIRSDANEQKTELFDAAREQVQEEKERALKKARLEAEDILAHAEREKAAIVDRVQAEEERDERNAQLCAKQELVQKVFALAEEKLLHLEPTQLQEALDVYLAAHPLAEDAVLELPKESTLQAPPGVKVERSDSFMSGFRVRRAGMRENFDYIEILQYMRHDLEQEVIRAMAEGEE